MDDCLGDNYCTVLLLKLVRVRNLSEKLVNTTKHHYLWVTQYLVTFSKTTKSVPWDPQASKPPSDIDYSYGGKFLINWNLIVLENLANHIASNCMMIIRVKSKRIIKFLPQYPQWTIRQLDISFFKMYVFQLTVFGQVIISFKSSDVCVYVYQLYANRNIILKAFSFYPIRIHWWRVKPGRQVCSLKSGTFD